MRAISIEFHGYRRLRDTGCNSDGKLIAFLGPNEAGKSSVLSGLNWFSNGTGELPTTDRYRPNKPTGEVNVVSVKYRLTDEDYQAVAQLGRSIGSLPEWILVEKNADGLRRITKLNPAVTRDPAPFTHANTKLAEVTAYISAHGDEIGADDSFAQLNREISDATDSLAAPEESWPAEAVNGLTELEALLRKVTTDTDTEDGQRHRVVDPGLFEAAAEAVSTAVAAHELAHPRRAVQDLLLERVPSFILFTEADRNLRATYNLADEATRTSPPAALSNLLTVAGSSVDALWTAMQDGDRTSFRSLLSTINATLKERVVTSWRQSLLTLSIVMNTDGQLEVLIEELDTKLPGSPMVDIAERSDGLRTFMALSCFLGSRDRSLPPILLVDEAETHLHYDAQADLLALLLQDSEIGQVFYTTHSPGCLPPDLGTGLRFVARGTTNPQESLLENSFWAHPTPGFSRLLFAMGAGAAAFSAFRHAVVCEGATEMILLPTLLRLANANAVIDFQVAPGLSSASSVDPTLRDIAIHTLFLVDGDAGGTTRRESLVAAGYDAAQILQLPANHAIEDLLDRDAYLDVVDTLIGESGINARVARDQLDGTVTIAKAVERWSKATRTKCPGHVIVAARLVADPALITLNPSGGVALRELYEAIHSGLDDQTSPLADG